MSEETGRSAREEGADGASGGEKRRFSEIPADVGTREATNFRNEKRRRTARPQGGDKFPQRKNVRNGKAPGKQRIPQGYKSYQNCRFPGVKNATTRKRDSARQCPVTEHRRTVRKNVAFPQRKTSKSGNFGPAKAQFPGFGSKRTEVPVVLCPNFPKYSEKPRDRYFLSTRKSYSFSSSFSCGSPPNPMR